MNGGIKTRSPHTAMHNLQENRSTPRTRSLQTGEWSGGFAERGYPDMMRSGHLSKRIKVHGFDKAAVDSGPPLLLFLPVATTKTASAEYCDVTRSDLLAVGRSYFSNHEKWGRRGPKSPLESLRNKTSQPQDTTQGSQDGAPPLAGCSALRGVAGYSTGPAAGGQQRRRQAAKGPPWPIPDRANDKRLTPKNHACSKQHMSSCSRRRKSEPHSP